MSSNARKENEETAPSFSLTSASSVFSSRSDDIFGSLGALEQKHAAHQEGQESSESLERAGIIKHDPVLEDSEDGEKRERKHSDSITRYRGSFSNHRRDDRNRSSRPWKNDSRDRNNSRGNFRHPRQLPPRSKRVPDFKERPEKWTSYSLDDVQERDLSEKSNTRAALDFLWERKNEREKQERLAAGLPAEEEKFESDTAACSKGLISFSRKKSKEKKMDCDDKLTSRPVGMPLSDEESDDLSSISELNSKSSFRKSQSSKSDDSDSISDLPKSNADDCDDDKQDNDPVPTFKSRKNVRKQFRRKNHDNETEDNDGEQ